MRTSTLTSPALKCCTKQQTKIPHQNKKQCYESILVASDRPSTKKFQQIKCNNIACQQNTISASLATVANKLT